MLLVIFKNLKNKLCPLFCFLKFLQNIGPNKPSQSSGFRMTHLDCYFYVDNLPKLKITSLKHYFLRIVILSTSLHCILRNYFIISSLCCRLL